mmetsp:Transcript_87842/g.226445  ORF Transcript_87842/g.226445 Transcript_87842/m.226445 type:complete len:452 (-) Transcript_87842:57-1412(-)
MAVPPAPAPPAAGWTCHYKGCRSSPDQIAALRARKPDGFPHDEDPSLRVCTVCRRLPLAQQGTGNGCADLDEPVEQLEDSFLAGIKEELSAIEENEKNIQALSQVLRYYATHAKQLSQVLFDFCTKQCFPWELIHALHLLDDILLMDNTGRYKACLKDRVQTVVVQAFRKVKSDQEKKEVARMLHTWQELKIFDFLVLEAVRAEIRSGGGNAAAAEAAARILDEAAAAGDDEDDEPTLIPPGPGAAAPEAAPAAPARPTPVAGDAATAAPPPKRPKLDGATSDVQAQPQVAKPSQAKVKVILDRIMSLPEDRPFDILGIAEGSDGHSIRKAYRRIALLIHPDKNPGMEALCGDALIKLQQGREQAETDLQRADCLDASRGDTRSAATAAAANATVDASFKCRHPECNLPPCKQCANQCCTRNITHCHMLARSKGGMQCFFHPPPRAWARNA